VGLSEAIGKEQMQRKGGVPCSICSLIPTLDKADREVLQSALDNPTIYGTAIAAALTAEGHKTNGAAVNRHRRGGCVRT